MKIIREIPKIEINVLIDKKINSKVVLVKLLNLIFISLNLKNKILKLIFKYTNKANNLIKIKNINNKVYWL